MTVKRFLELLKENDIPSDVALEADTCWEGGSTNIRSFVYNAKEKRLVGLSDNDETDIRDSIDFYKERYHKEYRYNLDKDWKFIQ